MGNAPPEVRCPVPHAGRAERTRLRLDCNRTSYQRTDVRLADQAGDAARVPLAQRDCPAVVERERDVMIAPTRDVNGVEPIVVGETRRAERPEARPTPMLVCLSSTHIAGG